jgi:hypothetical protein
MSEIIKQDDGSNYYKFRMPLELRQLSETTKGSDGVERTLAEWWDHIAEKSTYADGGAPLDMELLHLQDALDKTLVPDVDHVKAINAFSWSAGKYFKEALIDSIRNGTDKESIVKGMEKKVRSLAGSLGNTKWRKQGRASLGMCLLFYLEHHSALPATRNDLQQFTRTQPYGELPLSTMQDHLEWYGLEKLCGTYHIE